MVRIAYLGTDGCPGHHVIPIRGKFTEEDIKVIESIDCDDFYKVFDVMRFKIAEFKGWTILGIPASLDDHRPGSKTVIFIEGKANEADFIEVIQAAASYIFRSSFVSEDQARKAMVKAGNNATKILVKTFRGKLFKKAFERARRGKDINSFEKQEKVDGLNFLYNPNNDRMRNGHIIIDGTGLFKQIIKSGT